MEARHLQPVQLELDHATTARATASASTCSRTSCTRRIVAPRSYAATAAARLAESGPVVASGSPSTRPSDRLREKPIDDRPPERREHVEPAHELEVVLHRLAEADSRVEADLLLAHALCDGERDALLQERRDLGRDVAVARIDLHRPRLALHVHQAEVGARVRDDGSQRRITPERGYVVHELHPELECASGDLRLRSVDRDRELARDRLEHGQHSTELLVDPDTVGAGPGGLAADVDDRRAVGHHPPGGRDGVIRVGSARLRR